MFIQGAIMADPFFSSVLALLPFTGAGQTFADHGPLHLNFTFDAGAPSYRYEEANLSLIHI